MATILIVDDQPVNRHYLATLLGYFDHECLEAANGVEGLRTLKEQPVDLVIADVLMPMMDGYDFLQRIRVDPSLPHTPFIFYTAAHYESESRAVAEAYGVRHFLTKPAEPEIILGAVNSALGSEIPGISSASMNKFNHHVQIAPPADPIDPNSVVFIVDDDSDVRHFLTEIVKHEGLKAETFASGQEFLDRYDPNQPGCLLVDISMPRMTGIAMLEILRSRRIHIPAIVLTGHGHIADAVDAMHLGVLDFLEKTVDRRILLAKTYLALQEDSIKRRAQRQTEEIAGRMASLTEREKDLVKLLVVGKTSKEIAAELCISVKTVSHHRARLMAKTRAVNLADLVRMTMTAAD